MNARSDEEMASKAALKSAKQELRSLMNKKLAKITTDSIHSQSIVVFRSLADFKPYQEAKRICIYLSMPSKEIQTDAIVRHALESGKKVFVPYLYKAESPPPDTPKSVMDMVHLHSLSDYESLQRDNWGIPTIETDSIGERERILGTAGNKALDMILIPGVAFDLDPKTGVVKRLGHGKGFYDYFLHQYQQSRGSHLEEAGPGVGRDVLLYGLALEEQFMQAGSEKPVPVGEHDNPLHGLFIGNGNIVETPIIRV